MYTRISGINHEIARDLNYLTTNDLIPRYEGSIPRPDEPGQNIFENPYTRKVISAVETYVWPTSNKETSDHIEPTGRSSVNIEGYNFSSSSLQRLSILAALFRSGR